MKVKVICYQNYYLVTQLATSLYGHPQFLGAPVEIGRLPNYQHGIRGTLYALDETTLFIEDFEYDGQGPG